MKFKFKNDFAANRIVLLGVGIGLCCIGTFTYWFIFPVDIIMMLLGVWLIVDNSSE